MERNVAGEPTFTPRQCLSFAAAALLGVALGAALENVAACVIIGVGMGLAAMAITRTVERSGGTSPGGGAVEPPRTEPVVPRSSVSRRPADAAQSFLHARLGQPDTRAPAPAGAIAMAHCIICHFETVLDDVALQRDGKSCVCLGCYARQTGSTRPMPATLRRTLAAVMVELESQIAETVWERRE